MTTPPEANTDTNTDTDTDGGDTVDALEADAQAVDADAPLQELLAGLPAMRDAARAMRQTLLANLVMAGEIPAPTFHEHDRVGFIQDRFNECGLQNCSTDEVDNAVAILPGREKQRNILVVAHVDTVFGATVDHTISIHEDRAVGPGVGDNSLGVAAVITLPTLLEHLGIELRSNLVLMGASRSLGRGDLAGLRFFLNNTAMPIESAVCVEGVQIGRLSHASIGMLRGEISVEVPDHYDWTRFGAIGAIDIINEVINRIQDIPLPGKPRSSILLGAVKAGTSFNTVATQAVLQFEVRSESAGIVQRVQQAIDDLTDEVAAHTRAQINFEVVARREPGGVGFAHPLVRNARFIMRALDVKPRIAPSMSELSALIQHNVPALTLGITTGENLGKPLETVQIEPMFTGLAQLVAVLAAIDEGLCDED